MSLKKQFIKSQLKLKLVSNTPGQLKIKIGALPRLENTYKGFEGQVVTLLKLLEGVTDVQTVFDTGVITLTYDADRLTDRQVMQWINVFIDTAIDNMQFIASNWETNLPNVIARLTTILQEKAQRIQTN